MKRVLFIALLAGFTCMSCSHSEYKIEDIGTDYAAITITKYRGTKTDIIIPEKIKDLPVNRIGEYAFADKGLTSVIIPDSVRTIGKSAFEGNLLTNIVIPDNVTSIGDYAFARNNLTSVVIPDSVEYIGEGAFAGNELTTIVLGIFEYQIDSDLDTDIVFVQNIKDFEYETKTGGTNSASITITNYSGNKTDIIIPAKINNLPVKRIGESAFVHNKLTSVMIPDSVVSIGKNAFYNNNLTSVTISSNTLYIDVRAFADNEITTLIVDGIAYSYNDDFEVFAQYIKDFEYEIDNDGITITDYRGGRTDITIPAAINNLPVKHIGGGAFQGDDLTSVIISDGIETIGSNAFYFSKLTHIVIPNSVKRIGSLAFGSNRLTSVIIPDTVEEIDETAFSHNCVKGARYEFSIMIYKNEITIIGYNGSEKDIIIPSEINGLPAAHIGADAFYNENLTSIILPATIKTIGQSAFSYNYLTSINIPQGVISIGYSAFANNHITNILVPNSVKAIDAFAFYKSPQIIRQIPVELVLPEVEFSTMTYKNEITIIDYNGTAKDVVIPERINGLPVAHIGVYAFSWNDLTSVSIPNTVKTICYRAFCGNELTSLIIPESVVSIEYEAFAGNCLTNIVIPDRFKNDHYDIFNFHGDR